MTGERARTVLLCNATGAAIYSVLHLYLAWVRNLPVNINFALLVTLAVVALLATRLGPHVAAMIYSVTLWAAITIMTMNYANDPHCTGAPGVALWLALGAMMAGTCGIRQVIIYTQLSAVTFLWIVLAYGDLGYALVRYPLIAGAALAGYIYREYANLKGQLNKLETALRILKNAPQGRKAPR